MSEKYRREVRQYISISLFLAGVIILQVGVHNIDNSYNMCLLGDRWEFDYILAGDHLTSRQMYASGVKLQYFGFCFILGSFLLSLYDGTVSIKFIKPK